MGRYERAQGNASTRQDSLPLASRTFRVVGGFTLFGLTALFNGSTMFIARQIERGE